MGREWGKLSWVGCVFWAGSHSPHLIYKPALFKRMLEQNIIIFNYIIFNYRHNSSSRQSTDWAW